MGEYCNESKLSVSELKSEGTLNIFTLTPHPPLLGIHAGGTRIFEVIRRLSLRGHRLRLLTLRPPDAVADPETETALAPYLDRFESFPARQRRGYRDPLWLLPENYRWPKIERAIEQELEWCDVMHVEFAQTAHLIPANCPKPVLVSNHEVQTTTYLDYFQRTPWLSPERLLNLYRTIRGLYLETRILRRADAHIALTERDRRALRFLLPGKPVHLIPMGISLESFPKGPKRSMGGKLLYIGYYRHRPNSLAAHMLTEEILPRLWKFAPQITLTLAGSHPTENMQALADGRIHVTGRVDTLLPYYQAADIFVAPITTGRGMRGKILEAMATGLPVVGTPLALEGLNAQDGEHALIARTPAEFASAVQHLIADPALAHRIGERGRLLVQEFDWSAIGEMYETRLGEVIVARRGRAS